MALFRFLDEQELYYFFLLCLFTDSESDEEIETTIGAMSPGSAAATATVTSYSQPTAATTTGDRYPDKQLKPDDRQPASSPARSGEAEATASVISQRKPESKEPAVEEECLSGTDASTVVPTDIPEEMTASFLSSMFKQCSLSGHPVSIEELPEDCELVPVHHVEGGLFWGIPCTMQEHVSKVESKFTFQFCKW